MHCGTDSSVVGLHFSQLTANQELDLSELCNTHSYENEADDGAIYDLQSVVVHKGEYGSGVSVSFHF